MCLHVGALSDRSTAQAGRMAQQGTYKHNIVILLITTLSLHTAALKPERRTTQLFEGQISRALSGKTLNQEQQQWQHKLPSPEREVRALQELKSSSTALQSGVSH